MTVAVNGSARGRPGERRFRVEWLPGSDQLLGTCFCAAQRVGSEPNELWDWLLAHPEDHVAGAGAGAGDGPGAGAGPGGSASGGRDARAGGWREPGDG